MQLDELIKSSEICLDNCIVKDRSSVHNSDKVYLLDWQSEL